MPTNNPLPYLRFLFSDDDASRIDPNSIVVEPLPQTGDFPWAMRVRFRISQGGAPQIRPLLPGWMRFVADDNAPGIGPEPGDVRFDAAHYNQWKVVGSLIIRTDDPKVIRELEARLPEFPVKPNRIWYSPVRLSMNFLFHTICGRLPGPSLPMATLPLPRGEKAGGEEWQRRALAGFLKGTYNPKILPSNNTARYQGIVVEMPTVVEGANAGEYSIVIHTALSQDSSDSRWWDHISNPQDDENRSRFQGSHPRNGAIPAQLVYQELRGSMVPPETVVNSAGMVRNKIILPSSNPRPIYYLRFTRAWQPIKDFSYFFPQQKVQLENSNQEVLGAMPLPAHGILFLASSFVDSLDHTIWIRIIGNADGSQMKWLRGSDHVWREKGATNPLEIDPRANTTHVVLRRPMADALFGELSGRTAFTGDKAECYLSFRRFVRALVDNRIAGGRLNKYWWSGNGKPPKKGIKTPQDVRGLIKDAFSIANQESNGAASVSAVANNAPPISADPHIAAPSLIPILDVFFPDPVPQQSIPNRPSNAATFTKSGMAFDLWMSNINNFTSDATQRNFHPDHIGRGAPGAVVALGLAEYVLNPVRQAGESQTNYITRVHTAIMQNIQSRALLQLWNDQEIYESIRQRHNISLPENSGHPETFFFIDSDRAEFITFPEVDFVTSSLRVYSITQPPLRIGRPDIWIAANWLE